MNETNETRDDRQLLCTRNKKIDVYLLSSGRQVQVEAEMEDGVHHMRIRMTVSNPSLRIEEIRCEMPGVPDAVCREALSFLDPLIGKRVVTGFKKNLANNGPSKDCMLLMDLFDDVCTTLNQGMVVLGRRYLESEFPGIREEQIYKLWFALRPDIADSCVRYAEDSSFIRKMEEAEWPEGSEAYISYWKKVLSTRSGA